MSTMRMATMTMATMNMATHTVMTADVDMTTPIMTRLSMSTMVGIPRMRARNRSMTTSMLNTTMHRLRFECFSREKSSMRGNAEKWNWAHKPLLCSAPDAAQ